MPEPSWTAAAFWRTFARNEGARSGIAIAAITALQLSISLHHARSLLHAGNYDTAGYYIIARNFALGRGFTDSVLWQFLGDSSGVARAAGDYWGIGWPLVLGLLLRLFGHSAHAAILATALLSGLVPIAVFALVRAMRKGRLVGVLAALVVCLQERLVQTNVTPDMTLSLELTLLAGVWSYLSVCQRELRVWWRFALGGAALALPSWIRTDGISVLAVALLFHLISRRRVGASAYRETGWMFFGGLACQVPMYLYNLVMFHSLSPPARLRAMWMTEYDDLFRAAAHPSFSNWAAQGLRRLLAVRWEAFLNGLQQVASQPPWLLAAAVVAGIAIRVWRGNEAIAFLYWLLLALILFPALVVPVVMSADRVTMVCLPIVCIIATVTLWELARAWQSRGRVLAMLAGVYLFTHVYWPGSDHPSRGGRWKAAFSAQPSEIVEFDGRLPRDSIVMTEQPWQVAMLLDAQTVMTPRDGALGIREVIHKYHPNFVLARNRSAVGSIMESRSMDAEPLAQYGDFTWYALRAP